MYIEGGNKSTWETKSKLILSSMSTNCTNKEMIQLQRYEALSLTNDIDSNYLCYQVRQ